MTYEDRVTNKCSALLELILGVKEFYKKSSKDKSVKCLPYFPTKTITRRQGECNFKFDTTSAHNEANVEKQNTLKITEGTTNDEAAAYINQIIQ